MIPDYHDLFKANERERERALELLPVCCECDKPIQEETCFQFNGELVCEKCLRENHRVWTDDYIF